jgi:diguanylate cyclase (GGDEF)-like protein
MKLRTKASLFLSSLLLLVLLGQAVYFQLFLEKTLLAQVHVRQEELARLLAHRLDSLIKDAQNAVLSLARQFRLASLEPDRRKELEETLRTAFIHNAMFDNGFFVLDHQGRGVADYPVSENFRGRDFSFREYFQATRDRRGPVISAPYRSRRTAAPVITFTAPLLAYDGEFRGILAGSVNLLSDNVLGSLKNERIGQTGQVILYDSGGRLFFHPDPEITVQEEKQPVRGDRLFPFPGAESGTLHSRDPQGREWCLSFQRMKMTGWVVTIQSETAEFLTPLKTLRGQIALALVIALILAVGVGLWGMGIMVRPIQALSRSIKRFQGAEWEEPPGLVNRPDEIGELGRAFQEMSAALRSSLQALQEKQDRLEFLYALSEEVNHSLDLPENLDRAVALIGQKTRVPLAGILVLDESRQEAEHVSLCGFDPRETGDFFKPCLGWGVCKQVLETGETVVLPDCRQDPDLVPQFSGSDPLGALVLSPLKIQERVIGLLLLAAREPYAFSDDEVEFCQQAAPILAGAISNARSYRKTQELNAALTEISRLDGLTGIYNRRYLEERIQEEINRCRRLGGHLGMLMIDVDGFKQINDSCGHAVGDEVLKLVAGLLLKSCRNIDVVGRYGGDEFLVLLIETAEAEAEKIAGRIRERAGELTLAGLKHPVRLSIGVASRGQDYDQILRLADERMYAQKGKNLS